jgi:hypothetical protein
MERREGKWVRYIWHWGQASMSRRKETGFWAEVMLNSGKSIHILVLTNIAISVPILRRDGDAERSIQFSQHSYYKNGLDRVRDHQSFRAAAAALSPRGKKWCEY